MKKEDLVRKHFPMNLRFFGYGGGEGSDGSGAGGDDQAGKEDPDKDGDDAEDEGGEDQEEKKYSDKDMEAAVQKRLAREKRKWIHEQQNKPPAGGGKEDKDPSAGAESDAEKKAREAEERASALEMKWTCLEHDVKKDCVDDVLALAKVHMAKDEDLDIEDAIDKVLKKYPQFKDGYEDTDEDDVQEKKGWGQRHGRPPKKDSTVDDEIRKQLFGK